MGNRPPSDERPYWLTICKNPDNYDGPKRTMYIFSKSIKIKKCSICNQLIPVTQFRKYAKGLYGVEAYCKMCRNSKYKDAISNIEYKTKLKEQRAKNHMVNREKYNERHKKDFQEKKVIIYERRKKYYNNHPDKKLAELHRQHIRHLLKSGKKSSELLGCSKEFLKEWFDFHFTINKDFTIENHGLVWHIDHVIPVNKWNLDDETEMLNCFNWRNLMPLEKYDNILKKDTINEDQLIEQNRRLELFGKIKGQNFGNLTQMAKPTIAGTA